MEKQIESNGYRGYGLWINQLLGTECAAYAGYTQKLTGGR